MENSKDGQIADKDVESQDQPINADNPSSSEPEAHGRARKRSPEKKEKTAEVIKAQVQAEDFWKKIYNSMKNVESKEQAESLFRGLSSSKRVDNTPAKVEAQGEWPNSPEEVRKASELRARDKALDADGFVDVVVDSTTPEMFPYVAKKVDEESYAPDGKLIKRRKRKRYLCCSAERFWCTLMLLVPILIVLLTLYFVVLTPKDPTTSMEAVSISGFKLVDGGDGSTRVETTMNFTVRLRNPNKFAEVIYERLEVLLTYRTTALGSVSVVAGNGFKQQEKNLTLIEAQLRENPSPIADAADAQALKSDVSNGNVRMEFRGMAEGHFKIVGIKMGSFDTPVDCKLNIRPESSTQSAVLLSSSCYNRPT
ncbi:hypothetical protein Mapa_013880 [Marchantia paleacea]|nr:hypothetical protein Mapa_013880 [Marchantia paleacea]